MGDGCAASFPGAGENPGNEVWLYEVYDGQSTAVVGNTLRLLFPIYLPFKSRLERSWAPGTLKF